jgi:hypothetical protein
MSNHINNFPIENLVVSEIKNKKTPKLILANVPYPIGFETPVATTPFGIDSAYGKFYIKLSIDPTIDGDFLRLMQAVDHKLMGLVPGLKSNFTSATTLNCLLDRNVDIVDADGKNSSMFSIKKGDRLKATLELGDIYFNNTYKWMVRKIICMSALK